MSNSELGRTGQAPESESTICVFCEIIAGETQRIIVAETDTCVSFVSLEGHPLVVPKKHIGEIPSTEAEIQTLADTASFAVRLIPVVQRVWKASGVNILINLGQDAGQEVMHAHFHVIPRAQGDGKIKVFLERLPDEELDRLAKVFKSEIKV